MLFWPLPSLGVCYRGSMWQQAVKGKKHKILTLIGSYLKCTGEFVVKSYTPESVCTLEISPRCMASPSYLQPAMGLWDWIIWRRLASDGSGIHTLLKAIWQRFHTLISVAGSPFRLVDGAKIRAVWLPAHPKNVKQIKWAKWGGAEVLQGDLRPQAVVDRVYCQS